MAGAPATIDAYIAGFPAETQAVLQEIRRVIREEAPAAEEAISYKIPTFRLAGKYLVYFAGWKAHVSVYPLPTGSAAFERELDPWRAAKGTAKFPLGKPLPIGLIRKIVRNHLKARQG